MHLDVNKRQFSCLVEVDRSESPRGSKENVATTTFIGDVNVSCVHNASHVGTTCVCYTWTDCLKMKRYTFLLKHRYINNHCFAFEIAINRNSRDSSRFKSIVVFIVCCTSAVRSQNLKKGYSDCTQRIAVFLVIIHP
jgi:hypothetical protein